MNNNENLTLLIPAYNPSNTLIDLIHELLPLDIFDIIVLNDGSSSASSPVFDQLKKISTSKLHLLEHPTNLGKGAAIKTGLIYHWSYLKSNQAVITADADGQHLPQDIHNMLLHFKDPNNHYQNKLLLGERHFSSDIPLRSRFGNILTKKLVKLLLSIKINDTQTGLRCIPNSLIPHLVKIKNNRYEFELDMIITAHHKNFTIAGLPIKTVYIEGNKSSHFNPLIDSIKIYLVLFRFSLISLFSSLLDTLLFSILYFLTTNKLLSMIIGRIIVGFLNFNLNKRYVFHSDAPSRKEIGQYILLVLSLMSIAYFLLEVLVSAFHMKVIMAKIIAETILFISSFSVQHLFIFNKGLKKDEQFSPES